MFFTRSLFALFAFGAVGALAAPTPSAPVYTESADAVLAVVLGLQADVTAILPQIETLANAETADEASAAPVLDALVKVLVKANADIQLFDGKVSPAYGGKDGEIANIVADIYVNIATAIATLKIKKPHLIFLIAKLRLDVALFKVLVGLNIVVAGVLKLVAGLLATVGGILINLNLTLIVNLLGYYGGYGY